MNQTFNFMLSFYSLPMPQSCLPSTL